jgi:hypothetical protein
MTGMCLRLSGWGDLLMDFEDWGLGSGHENRVGEPKHREGENGSSPQVGAVS